MKIIKNPAKNRVDKREFNKLLFEYFELLNSGYVGWGISFIAWLEHNNKYKLTRKNRSEFEKM
jgi:hypothetical protein